MLADFFSITAFGRFGDASSRLFALSKFWAAMSDGILSLERNRDSQVGMTIVFCICPKNGLTRASRNHDFAYVKERFFDYGVNQYYTIAHVETFFADEV
ncbi:MAG: hypothetical protein EOP06_24745 [Proteobacteria bacterium]|nr:MAG: hypothetical protein EOP06_24745 [Pseudomonadota bacterium]